MKKRFSLFVLFALSLFALSFTACGSTSSTEDEVVDECLDNPTLPNCVDEEPVDE
ncbi:MAG: hypothetical protein J6Z31_09710 [Fibrobacter sp.]|nr:hypothetical protein [Fibrobacter sp.]